MKIKKKLLLISVTLILVILLIVLLLNSNNIYNLLKGNSWTIENIDLKEGEISAQIHDDKGYPYFDGDSSAYLSMNKSTKNPNVYDVKVRLKYTLNSTSKKAIITLKEGINLVSDGSEGLGKNKLKSISKTNSSRFETYYTNIKETSVGKTTYLPKNYTIAYIFDETLSDVSITLQISPDQALDYSYIKDAITIDLYQSDEKKNTKSIDVNEDFSAIGITIDGASNGNYVVSTDLSNPKDKYYDVENYNLYDNILGLYSYDLTGRTILYDYIYFVVKAPKSAILSGNKLRKTYVGNAGFPYKDYSTDTSADDISSVEKIDCSTINKDSEYYNYCKNNYNYISDYSTDYYKTGGSIIFKDSYNYDYDINYENSYDINNYNLYIFKVENIYTHMYGVVPIWKFDKNSVKKKVHVEGVNVTYKTHGGKKVSVDLNSIDNEKKEVNYLSVNNFNVTDVARIRNSNITYDVKSYNKNHREQDATLGYFTFENYSPIVLENATVTIDFDKNIGIASINLPDMHEVSNVIVKTNQGRTKNVLLDDKYSIKPGSDISYERYLLTRQAINLDSDEYITYISFSWNIPNYYRQNGAWYNSYTGIIFDNANLVDNTITTNIKVSKDEKVYADFNSIGKIDFENNILKIYPLFQNVSSSTILKAGDKSHFKVNILEINSNNSNYQRILYNPIIYIRSETGLDVTNISLVNSDGVNLCKKINCNVNAYINSKNEKIYRVDTSSINDGSAKVGYIGHRDSDVIKSLNLEFDIDIPIGFSDSEKTHNYSDMVYITSKESNEIYEYYTYIGYDRKNNKELFEELNAPSDEVVMTSKSTSSYYKIVSDVDLISNLYQKNKNDEFITWNSEKDDLSIDMDNNFELKLEVLNNTGYNFPYNNDSLEVATIYIPIPKKGQNWYNLSNNSEFNFSLNLNSITGKLERGNGTYSIFYSYVDTKKMNTNGTLNLDKLYKTTNWSDTLLEEHNVIKIEFNKLEKDSSISFYIDYELADNKEVYNEIKRQQFKYIMYKNISTKNGKITNTKIGNYVGITNELSKYNLLVIHKDIYNNILDTENSILEYGTRYETSKKEFENYEIFLEPPNKLYPEEPNGILLKDTTVTYVYKSTELRKAIVHYIDEDTNEKLFDEVELNGKDLEGFDTEYKTINGYNLSKIIKDGETVKPDDNIVKGSYTKDVQEITYYYKKIPIVSTLDNITTYIILFTISLVGIITFIVYKLKSKKDN